MAIKGCSSKDAIAYYEREAKCAAIHALLADNAEERKLFDNKARRAKLRANAIAAITNITIRWSFQGDTL